ncbi:MAG TPA: acetolactate decarboxylase [Isosphaeraceae bacterium]|jgi:acetolactate decarboxylase|nr:acetolactate decarboxylase [Isosphaeraceae bacterium]
MLSEVPFIRALEAWRLHHRASVAAALPDASALHEIFQNSTINALLEGVYDGSMTYGELRKHGDFGLGTFNALDGEMIAFDGDFYQVKADGVPYPVADDQRTPFATVLFFRPTVTRTVDGPLDHVALQALIEGLMEGPNLFYAVRLHGRFSMVTTRSVPRQEKPYRHLDEVAKAQSVFHLTDVRGTLAGFRFPDYTRGLNVPGFHLHFLTDDRQAGGHVLELRLEHGELAIDSTANFHLELPTDAAFLHADLGHDTGDALERAEHRT